LPLIDAQFKFYPTMEFPFHPIRRSYDVEKIVTKGNLRKYYRFRPAPYYGGIATGDTIGCNLLCAYCWNYVRNLNPEGFGRYYSPSQVAQKLLGIAKKKNFQYVRLTGAEPILGEASFTHFLQILELVLSQRTDLVFILETNGLILGYQKELILNLKGFKNLSIRIAIKAWDEESFTQITGADKEFFIYPLLALKNLRELNLDAWSAVMGDLFTKDRIRMLKAKMKEVGISEHIETEELERYPYVLENIQKRNIQVYLKFKA